MLCSSSPTMPCSVYAGFRFILTASFWHGILLAGKNGKLVRFISVSVSLKAASVLNSLTLHPSDIILKYKHFFLPTDFSKVKTTDNDNNLKMLKKRLYSESKHIIKQEKSPFPTSRCQLKAAAESSSSRVTSKIKIFPLRPPPCSSSFFILHFQSSLLTCPYVHLNPSYQLHVSHF